MYLELFSGNDLQTLLWLRFWTCCKTHWIAGNRVHILIPCHPFICLENLLKSPCYNHNIDGNRRFGSYMCIVQIINIFGSEMIRHRSQAMRISLILDISTRNSVVKLVVITNLTWYPLVNQPSYGKSLFLMGKSTINGHFQ